MKIIFVVIGNKTIFTKVKICYIIVLNIEMKVNAILLEYLEIVQFHVLMNNYQNVLYQTTVSADLLW